MGKAKNTTSLRFLRPPCDIPPEGSGCFYKGGAGRLTQPHTISAAGFRHKHDGGERSRPPCPSWPRVLLHGHTDAHRLPETLISTLPATPKLDTHPNRHSGWPQPPSNTKVVQHCA